MSALKTFTSHSSGPSMPADVKENLFLVYLYPIFLFLFNSFIFMFNSDITFNQLLFFHSIISILDPIICF